MPAALRRLAATAADRDRYQEEILSKRVSILDLLEQYTFCDLSFGEFLEVLPSMRVRQYSISSSPRVNPARCSVTVAVVDAPAWSGNGQFHGTASNYRACRDAGDQVRRHSHTQRPLHTTGREAGRRSS